MRLEFNKVSVTYEGNNVLDGLSFSLKEGEVLAIYGEHKSGLTTIASLLKDPDFEAGSVSLDDKPLDSESPISILNDKSQLFNHLNIKNSYLSYVREAEDFGKNERINKIAEKLELADVLDKKPAEISNGQYLRALIGKALLNEPKVLVLDNALVKMDGVTRTNFWKEIRLIAKRFNIGILFLTHNASEAMMVGDKVGYLKYGKMLALDTPTKIYKEPKTVDVALAFSFPPLSLLKGEYLDGSVDLNGLVISVPSFKEKHDDYYKNALKNLPSDNTLYEPYTHALTQKHTLLVGFRADAFVFDGVGPLVAVVKSNEAYGSKNILHIEMNGNELLCYANGKVEEGKEIKLTLKEEPDLIFDPLTKMKI